MSSATPTSAPSATATPAASTSFFGAFSVPFSKAPEGVNGETWEAAWDAMSRFVHIAERQLLSPVWSLYITGIWKPAQRAYLADYAAGKVADVGAEFRAVLRDGSILHPFNMSNSALNAQRAKHFLAALKKISKPYGPASWWPKSEVDLIKTLAEEQAKIQKSPHLRRRHESAAARINVEPFVKSKVGLWLDHTKGKVDGRRSERAHYEGPEPALYGQTGRAFAASSSSRGRADDAEDWSVASLDGRDGQHDSGRGKRRRRS